MRNYSNWRFKRQYNINSDEFETALFSPGTREYVAMSIKEYEPATVATGDRLTTFPNEIWQAVMDGLWETGFKPSGYVGTERVQSMQDHISDLRAIAFKLVGVNDSPSDKN